MPDAAGTVTGGRSSGLPLPGVASDLASTGAAFCGWTGLPTTGSSPDSDGASVGAARLSQSGNRPDGGFRSDADPNPFASSAPRRGTMMPGSSGCGPEADSCEPSIPFPAAPALEPWPNAPPGGGKDARAGSGADVAGWAKSPPLGAPPASPRDPALLLSAKPRPSVCFASANPSISSRDALGAVGLSPASPSTSAAVAPPDKAPLRDPTGSSAMIFRIEARISSMLGSVALSALDMRSHSPGQTRCA